MQDSQTRASAPADVEREVSHNISTSHDAVERRAAYDRAFRQRKRGIYVLPAYVSLSSWSSSPPAISRLRCMATAPDSATARRSPSVYRRWVGPAFGETSD